MTTLKHVIQTISVLSPLFPLLIFLFLKGKSENLSVTIKIVLFYLVLSFITDLICYTFVFKYFNNLIIEVYALFEIVLVLLIYGQVLKKNINIKLFNIIIFFLVIVSCIPFFPYPQVEKLSTYIFATRTLIVVFISIVSYFILIENFEYTVLTDNFFFWLNTAFFVYFSVFFCIQLFKHYILDPNSSQAIKNLWIIHNLFHIIYNTLIAIGIYKWKKMKI